MKKTLLTAAALAFALSTGAALAQSSNATADAPVYNTENLVPFHTDDTMATLNPAEQNKEHFLSLPADQQQALRDECSKQMAGDMTDTETDTETTASIEGEAMPATIADLCAQVETW